jgi:hypothetical protein
VERFSEDDRPVNRDRFQQPNSEEVFASLIVNLWNKSPWPACVPCGHFVVEDPEVLVRSRDLSLYPCEGTRVNLHDVILAQSDDLREAMIDATDVLRDVTGGVLDVQLAYDERWDRGENPEGSS